MDNHRVEQVINTILIPTVVIILMVIVGTGLRPNHFAVLLRVPVQVLGSAMFQALILPLAALLIIVTTEPRQELMMGLLLVAVSPGGALSNYYCHLGRLDSALSVILTVASSLAAFFLMPLVLAIALSLLVEQQGVSIVVTDVIIHLMVMLLIPVFGGMLLRHLFTDFVEASAQMVRRISLVLVVVLLALIVFDQWATTRRIFIDAAWLTALFTLLALAAGWLFGLVARMNSIQRHVMAIEFAVRNAGIAAVVASTQLGRPEFAAFSALFVVFQFPFILLLLHLSQRGRASIVSDETKTY